MRHARAPARSRSFPWVHSLLLAAAVSILPGCASPGRRVALRLEPAEWDAAVRELGLDPASVVCPVRFTPEMRTVALRLQHGAPEMDTERVNRLHDALLDRRNFAFEYEKNVTFTAAEAFAARRGNCVSFSNLLIALGRSIGIPLRAGLFLTRGTSEKEGDLTVFYTHMVAVYVSSSSYHVYDFYRDRSRIGVAGELRLIDDLEIAAIELSNRGVAALKEGNMVLARDLLEKAVRLAPKLPDLHSNLGIAIWRLGDVGSALAAFRRGLELDPHRAALLNNLAALYLKDGRVSEARVALAAANVAEASAYLLVVKGDLEYASGDPRSALRSYKRAHAKDRTIVPPLLGMARAENALGDSKAARKVLEKALRLKPDDVQVQELLKSY